MEKNLFRIHEVEGLAYEIQYTIVSQRRVFPAETEVEKPRFLENLGALLKSRGRQQVA